MAAIAEAKKLTPWSQSFCHVFHVDVAAIALVSCVRGGSWIRIDANRTQSGTHRWCQECRVRLNFLCHNASPKLYLIFTIINAQCMCMKIYVHTALYGCNESHSSHGKLYGFVLILTSVKFMLQKLYVYRSNTKLSWPFEYLQAFPK